MKALKTLLGNLSISVLSVVIVLGGAELAIRASNYRKIETYYDTQARDKLGRPVPPKQPGEYRIFLFGESAAYGFPVSDRYSISKWLEKSFSYLLPDRKVTVVNCGWAGKSSHEVLEGGLGMLNYQPDLFILYVGNNEAFPTSRLFLDNRLYHAGLVLYYRSHFYRWLDTRVKKAQKYFNKGKVQKQYRNESVAEHVYTRPDVSDTEYLRILDRYRSNMSKLIRAAKAKGVDVLMITPPSNMKDFPPLLSMHPEGFGNEAEWNRLFEEGKQSAKAGDFALAAKAFEQALTLDPDYAETSFQLAQAYEKLGRFEEAKKFYEAARDLDDQPWRPKEAVHQTIRALAAEEKVMFVDTYKIFEDMSPYKIISTDLVFDNVHPSIYGQQVISDEILKELTRQKKISDNWQWAALENSRKNYPQEWKVDGALKAYQPILKGILSWEARHYEEAIPELESGLKLMPDFVELYGFLGDAYLHTGHQEKAAEVFREFQQKNPSVFDFMLKKYPEVQDGYTKAMAA